MSAAGPRGAASSGGGGSGRPRPPRRRAACSACQGSREPTWRLGGEAACSERQHLEDVALEGEVAHDEGPGQTELAGRPQQPPHGVGRAHLECVRRRGGPREVPSQNSNAHRRRAAEEVGQQRAPPRRAAPPPGRAPPPGLAAGRAATGAAWR